MHRPNELCTALRNWRIHARLQQSEIARSLGVTQSQVSRWESGRDIPRPHNVEAIRRLIWGPEADPLRALKHFVEHSSQHLMLIDMHHMIVARSLPLRAGSALFEQFGWVLDPHGNPAFAPAWKRFVAILDQPSGTVGLNVTLPFQHDGRDWQATLEMIVCTVGGMRVCLAEPSFTTIERAEDIRFEATHIAADDTEHQTITLWRNTH